MGLKILGTEVGKYLRGSLAGLYPLPSAHEALLVLALKGMTISSMKKGLSIEGRDG